MRIKDKRIYEMSQEGLSCRTIMKIEGLTDRKQFRNAIDRHRNALKEPKKRDCNPWPTIEESIRRGNITASQYMTQILTGQRKPVT